MDPMRGFTNITSAEFDAELRAYPRPLDRHVVMICEPPCLMFYDKTLSKGHTLIGRYFDGEPHFGFEWRTSARTKAS